MKNIKEILVCGGEGGSVTQIKKTKHFFIQLMRQLFLSLRMN